jgi:signal transduction histidine kinase
MVDDLSEISLQAPVLKLTPESWRLADLVDDVVAGSGALARSRNVRLRSSVPPNLVLVADHLGLSRVVSNLVINAIKHTPAHGIVEIIGRSRSDEVELAVSDGCGGLTNETMQRVFDPRWQGTTESERSPQTLAMLGKGAGLGLFIVKTIIEAHRGRVAVANRDLGCQFSVLLPRPS